MKGATPRHAWRPMERARSFRPASDDLIAEVMNRLGVDRDGAVAYLDGEPAHPGFVELIPATPGLDAGFTAFWRASVDWDGQNPIRPFG